MKPIIAMLLLVLSLIGCNTVPPAEKTVFKFIAVPKELTQKVPITAPPVPESYSVLTWDQKEEILTDLIQKHTESIGVCNARIGGVDSWSAMQSKIYAPTP